MRGQHAAPEECGPWKLAALRMSDWIISMGLRFCVLMIALFVVVPMAVQRGLGGHRPAAHAAPHQGEPR